MTQAEKDVLDGIVQILENLIVRADAVEGTLLARSLIVDGEVALRQPAYIRAAQKDLALIRQAIVNLPLTRS